jgi:dynein heavy chain 1
VFLSQSEQIERQLLTYMKRVEDVLGKGWELYAEGQKLQSESAAFRRKLDTRPVFEAWLHDINRRDMVSTGDFSRLFGYAGVASNSRSTSIRR